MTARPLGYAAALAILVAGALFARQRVAGEAARHTLDDASASLPSLPLSRELAASITRIELLTPDGEPSERRIVLEKRPPGWRLTEPLKAIASTPKVLELLENLRALRVHEVIDTTTARYQAYGLSDERAFHVRAYSGPTLLRDLYFGKGSARGQLLRVGRLTSVFSVAEAGPGSYAGYLYTRPLRSWREPRILDFDPRQVREVQIDNPHGELRFLRQSGTWVGTMRRRNRSGELVAVPSWKRFAPQRVEQLLNTFSRLSADELGAEGDRQRAGVDDAERSGGVLTIAFQSGARTTLAVGNVASGPSTWAIAASRWAVQTGPEPPLYALALWTTDWVTSGASRFEE